MVAEQERYDLQFDKTKPTVPKPVLLAGAVFGVSVEVGVVLVVVD